MELGIVASLIPEFTKRNVKCIALSHDTVDCHKDWIKDIQAYNNISKFNYPIIFDELKFFSYKLNIQYYKKSDKIGRAVS